MPRTVVSTMVLLALWAPAPFAWSAPGAEPVPTAIGRFIGDDTIAVAHVDTSRVSAAGIRQWHAAGAAVDNGNVGTPGQSDSRAPPKLQAAAQWLERAREAGVRDVYLVVKTQPRGLPVPAVIVPVKKGDDPKAIEALLSCPEGGKGESPWGKFTTTRIGDTVVLAPAEAVARFKDAKPGDPEWVSQALSAVAPDAVRFAFAPDVQMKVLIEDAASAFLDDPLAGDPRGFPEGIRWAVVGLGAPPDGTFQLVVDANRPDAAEVMANEVAKLLESVKAAGALGSFVSDPARFVRMITPKAEGNQLVLTLTGEQVAELVSQLSPSGTRKRTTPSK